jgi:signal transduction histidine kinase
MELLTEPGRPDTVDARPASNERSRRWLPLLVLAVIAISIGHYATDPVYAHWHVVFQRLYYLPILVAAVLYGLRGGLGLAVLTAVLYFPHVVLHWGHDTAYRWAQFTEIGLFPVFGALAGGLIERVRAERERHRRTADELARAYEQLRATFDRLRFEDRMSALGALSVGMAHEIRNPLGAISGAIEILEGAIPESDDRHEFVGILKREIARLNRLVGRQLDLARTEPERVTDCDLGMIAREVTELARARTEAQKVTLRLRVDSEVPAVRADPSRLRQAVLNLVVNAIQAMPQGGDLDVSVRAGPEDVRLVVEDRGPGIPVEAEGRLFEPFFTTKSQGTGLGLAIAWQIAHGHGGELSGENRLAGGARFTLRLPVPCVPGDAHPEAS